VRDSCHEGRDGQGRKSVDKVEFGWEIESWEEFELRGDVVFRAQSVCINSEDPGLSTGIHARSLGSWDLLGMTCEWSRLCEEDVTAPINGVERTDTHNGALLQHLPTLGVAPESMEPYADRTGAVGTIARGECVKRSIRTCVDSCGCD
jgi:hypothetical protein